MMMRELEAFNLETIDERARLAERTRALEE
jgi:hypothetical protein